LSLEGRESQSSVGRVSRRNNDIRYDDGKETSQSNLEGVIKSLSFGWKVPQHQEVWSFGGKSYGEQHAICILLKVERSP
jgi:hypothetical protein